MLMMRKSNKQSILTLLSHSNKMKASIFRCEKNNVVEIKSFCIGWKR